MDPFDLIRVSARVLLLLGTAAALVLWATGIRDDALLFAGALWSLYGFIRAVIDGLLDPLLEGGARLIHNVGLLPYRPGYSHIESMAARHEYDAAAASYATLAARGDAEAQVRRAELLAGPIGVAEKARIELEEFREQHRLSPREDVRLSLALAKIYEQRLDDPGRAMREIRRLLDLYPNARPVRHLDRTLIALKRDHFDAPTP